MNDICLLYSTGLDSYLSYQYLKNLGKSFDCIYFDYKGKYSIHELDKLNELVDKKILENVIIFRDRIDLGKLEQSSAFIPNRNILLTTLANSLGYDKIFIGGSRSDRVCDNNKEVFDEYSKFLTNMNSRIIKIDSLFWSVYKSDVMKWYLKQKGEDVVCIKELINNTFSCYNPNPVKTIQDCFIGIKYKIPYTTLECRECNACFRKCVELYSIGGFIKFYNKEIVEKYKKEFTTCIENPSDYRAINTLKYIEALEWNEKFGTCI